MRYSIFFLVVLIIASCTKHEVIKYEYKGVVITRVDKDSETYFYYGDCSKEACPDSFIKVNYSGFNSGLSGLLIFHENKSVELVSLGGGYFDISENKDSRIFIKEGKNSPEFNLWLDSIKGNYENVVDIARIELEKELNIKNHSKVKVFYPKI